MRQQALQSNSVSQNSRENNLIVKQINANGTLFVVRVILFYWLRVNDRFNRLNRPWGWAALRSADWPCSSEVGTVRSEVAPGSPPTEQSVS